MAAWARQTTNGGSTTGALELGCTADELRSAMGEAGRVLFDFPAVEQFELDLGAPA